MLGKVERVIIIVAFARAHVSSRYHILHHEISRTEQRHPRSSPFLASSIFLTPRRMPPLTVSGAADVKAIS